MLERPHDHQPIESDDEEAGLDEQRRAASTRKGHPGVDRWPIGIMAALVILPPLRLDSVSFKEF